MADRTSAIAQYPIDETGLLAASWVLGASLGVAFMQLMTYLPTRAKDSKLLQATVTFLFLNETVSMILMFVGTHKQLLISKPGSLESLSLPKTFIIASFHADVTLFGVNVFLIDRYYRLTQRWWISVPLGLLACAATIVHFCTNSYGLSVASLVLQPSIDLPVLFGQVDTVMRLSKVASTLEFTLVAVTYSCLVIELTKFLRQDLLHGKKVVWRLLMATVESGIVTFALTASLIALSWSAPVPTSINIVMTCCARAYYHTLLFNLNMRSHGGMMMQEADPTLSHITSALRTRNTVIAGIEPDNEMPAFKAEEGYKHVDDALKKQEKEAPYASNTNQSAETV